MVKLVCYWFEIWTFWFGIGSVGPNLPNQCKPNVNVRPSEPPDGDQQSIHRISLPILYFWTESLDVSLDSRNLQMNEIQ